MTKNQAWVKALRLRTLPLSLSGIILGSFIAKYNGYWSLRIFTLAMLTTILFQILSNFANDLGDSLKGTDNSQRVGPLRSVQSGMITAQQMKIAILITAILSAISAISLILIGTKDLPISILWLYVGLAMASILAAITYTIGKKAYGYNGFGDLMVFLFFGYVTILGVYPLFTKTIDWNLLLPATSIGLLSAAVLNLNNMRDRLNDKNSGKKTFVVLIGGNAAKVYHAILIIGALICHYLFIAQLKHPMAYIGLIPGLVLIIHLRKVMKTRDPKEFDPELKKVALATFGIAVLTAIGLMIP